MCNNYERRIGYSAYRAAMRAAELLVPDWQVESDLPQTDNVRISDVAPVMRAAGDMVELVAMAFGFPPPGPMGSPVFNYRSENRAFRIGNRCIIPASAFFEFTGAKYPKTKHRFSLIDERWMGIAGCWRAGRGNRPPSFAMLTTSPGPDVAPYHDRQIVVLRPEDWGPWLFLAKVGAELLTSSPRGSLAVETVRPGVK